MMSAEIEPHTAVFWAEEQMRRAEKAEELLDAAMNQLEAERRWRKLAAHFIKCACCEDLDDRLFVTWLLADQLFTQDEDA